MSVYETETETSTGVVPDAVVETAEGAVSETAGANGRGRGRGRPRAADTLARDAAVVELLQTGPQTVAQLAEQIGVDRGKTYLCIYRLRQQGQVEKVKVDGAKQPSWQLISA